MKSNMFANVEERFRLASEAEITQIVRDSVNNLVFASAGGGAIPVVFLIPSAVSLGCAGSGLTDKRKRLFMETMGHYLQNHDELFEKLSAPPTQEEFGILKLISMLGNDIAFSVLNIILGFACVDGDLDDDVAEQLEAAFGINLLADFIQSGATDVPAQRVYVSGLEEEITDWFAQEDRLIPLNEIKAHFSGRTGTEVQSALDSLVQKDVLYGGENMIMNMYGLVSPPAKSRATASKTKKNTTSSKTTATKSASSAKSSASSKSASAPKTAKKSPASSKPMSSSRSSTSTKPAAVTPPPAPKTEEELERDREKAHKEWERMCREIDEERQKRIAAHIAKRTEELNKALPKEETELAPFRKRIEDLKTERENALKELAGIPGYKLFSKLAVKKHIREIDEKNLLVQGELQAKREDLATQKRNVEKRITEERDALTSHMVRKLPYPVEPPKPMNSTKKVILEVLSRHRGEMLTISDIHFAREELLQLSTQTLAAEIGDLIRSGKVNRYSDKRRTLFRLA